MFGAEVAQSAGRFSVTSAGITEALRAVAKERDVPLAQLSREVREEMRLAGALSQREVIEEHKVKE